MMAQTCPFNELLEAVRELRVEINKLRGAPIERPNAAAPVDVSPVLKQSSRAAWSLREVAELTGLSVSFLRNEAAAERLHACRFGRRVLVRDEDLKKYLSR
jgi:excisionase family DNA binding protein